MSQWEIKPSTREPQGLREPQKVPHSRRKFADPDSVSDPE